MDMIRIYRAVITVTFIKVPRGCMMISRREFLLRAAATAAGVSIGVKPALRWHTTPTPYIKHYYSAPLVSYQYAEFVNAQVMTMAKAMQVPADLLLKSIKSTTFS